MRITMFASVLALFITNPLAAVAQTPIGIAETMPAPTFDLPLIGGGSMKSEDLKGSVVVLDLWATWCPPCNQEISGYNALYEQYRAKDVRVIGIALMSGSFDDVQAKVAEFQVRYPVLYGTEKVFAGFGINGFPATYVLTKDGTVHRRYLGLVPDKKELIEREIDALLSPTSWLGTWTLNLDKSKHDPDVFKSLTGIEPKDILRQQLKLEEIGGKLKMTGDVVVSGRDPVHEEGNLNLDGSELILADGVSASFKRIDDVTFEWAYMLRNNQSNIIGVNRFEVSPDGKTLTRTNTQTFRNVVPTDTDPTKGAVIKTAVHLLIYERAF